MNSRRPMVLQRPSSLKHASWPLTFSGCLSHRVRAGPREVPAPNSALRLLGLAARAGALLPGTERVRDAARSGTLRFALVAADVSDNSLDKLLPTLRKRGVPHVVMFTRDQLGQAVGKSPLSAVGITHPGFAEQLQALLPPESGESNRGI